MPSRLLQYVRDTGAIQGLWEGAPVAYVQQQRVADDPIYAYLELAASTPEADLPADVLLEQWYVQAHVLRRKGRLTLTALPNPFPGDGQTACRITVAPFVPCTLRVHGVSYGLTVEDPVLVLTSDSPAQFVVTVQPMATHVADLLRVEAI